MVSGCCYVNPYRFAATLTTALTRSACVQPSASAMSVRSLMGVMPGSELISITYGLSSAFVSSRKSTRATSKQPVTRAVSSAIARISFACASERGAGHLL